MNAGEERREINVQHVNVHLQSPRHLHRESSGQTQIKSAADKTQETYIRTRRTVAQQKSVRAREYELSTSCGIRRPAREPIAPQ